ncbi:Armadillo-like helical [Penicillium longicatenatum]|nr:Armadillo-like helical [Penicillium longicatenatum]
MEQNGPAVQVIINGHPQSQQAHTPNMSLSNRSRPLSVDEALQYSSMSSAPVFGIDCIVRPDVGRPSTTTSINHVLQAGRNTLSELDAEIQSGQDESSRLETSREYLQQLLDGDQLTEFKFKVPSALSRRQPSQSATPDDPPFGRNQLGSFAKMMLDSTDIAFRYPEVSSPTTAPTITPKETSKVRPKVTEKVKPEQKEAMKSTAAAWNQQAFVANKSISTSNQLTPPTQPPQPIQRSSSQLSVVIPVKPSPSKSTFSKQGQEVNRPRPQVARDPEESMSAIRLRDQKAEADDALLKLQDLLNETFEAEDEIEPEQAIVPSADRPNPTFVNARSLDVHGALLSNDAHNRLQKAIRKVVGFDRLQDIPSDYLTRIQKLCEKPIIASQAPDLRLNDSTNEAEVHEWMAKIEDILNALLAIGTLLQTMSGRRTERDLCPEDLIEAIPTVLNQVFDHCIIPAVESRPGGKDSELFSFFSSQKRIIASLIHQGKKALTLFADFLSRIDVSEGTITAAEFFATKLIFVENAHNDKDSAVGFQKYEPARRAVMDVLAKIFSKYPDQRPFILDEILISLEKLPSTRQSARQFKLADGKNIQLLTALVLQLVQTTALETPSRSKAKRRFQGGDDDELMGDGDDIQKLKHNDGQDEDELDESLERLATKVNRLYDNAVRSAQYIVKFIVQRAMTSTKSGDQPFRNILDLFTEDLINVLGSTDWPAAELLLRIMASHMVGIADLDKSPATAKSMALELLGWMGSAISDLIATAQHMLPALEDSEDSDLTDFLKQQFEESSSRALHPQDLITSRGPYRMALEYLSQDRNSDNWQLTSARGYYLAQWAKTVCTLYYNPEDKEELAHDDLTDELVILLSRSFSDPRWLETHRQFDTISNAHGRFAYILTVLNSSFGKAFDTILKVLLNSIASEQAKVRSRSLKSVIYMLEKDPNLLDRDASVMRVILRCTTDASPMVRDSALSLIAKCIGLKSKLEEEGCRCILACATDQTAGVRKRCIGLLKELYHKTSRQDLKLAILDSFLQRTGDLEESVATLARQTFEEIWLVPFHEFINSTSDAPKLKMALGEQVGLVVSLVQRSETALDSLSTCLKAVLSDKSKSADMNFKVCKTMVSIMFQRLVEDADALGKDSQQALLQTITVFAKSNAKLFSSDQLEALHPYIGHLATADDLFIFRSVVVIYRCVLPYMSTSHNTLLKEVQNDLFKSVAKLARSELNEVMACLWTINSVLQNTDRLVKLTVSVLKPLQQYKSVDVGSAANAAILARAKSYIRIAGCVGRHCDLEKYVNHFKNSFPTWNGGAVAGLMVDSILPFTYHNQPLELRVMALESLGSICQSWPAQFGREPTRKTFAQVFKEDSPSLQNIVLRSFADFFAIHEGKSEKSVMPASDIGSQEDSTRLGGSLKANDNDGAAALIAQHFLKNMLKIAQSRQDTYSLTAIELIASINRQGLVHPKECAGVLVSLETSTIPTIAKIAFDTHKMLHSQYESMFEREYMRAVQEAFYYQRDVVGDSTGAYARPYVSKLAPLFEIVKISNSRYQKKFLSNLCGKVNFELKKLNSNGDPPEHLLLTRFIAQNLAHFDYGQLAELVPTILVLERIVSSTGTVVAHAIETDIFPSPIGPPMIETPDGMMGMAPPVSMLFAIPQPVNPSALRSLATAAASLSMLWEARTFLRRLYGVHSHGKDGKPVTKELNKTASKVHGVTGDKFWEAIARNMTSLDSEDAMLRKCREFSTLLAIDEEFKVDRDDDAEGDLDAMGEFDDMDGVASGPRPMKRKSSVSSTSISKRPKSRIGSVGKKRSSTDPDDWD